MKKPFLILLFLNYFIGFTQDWQWWNDKHNWDGITPWQSYFILSPKYMGPNALPVTENNDGLVLDYTKIEISAEKHFSKGDNTENLYTEIFIPIALKKVGLKINIVPFEHYKMDTITRDFRKARDYDGEGTSGGDFYVSTLIQLVQEKKNIPDIMLSINLKTASGTNYSGVRFTDSPGYFFDISIGKYLKFNNLIIDSVRIYNMLGFYAWQTNHNDYRQDDAILYGMGAKIFINNFMIENSLSGYYGYINNGDRPLVFRSILKYNIKSRMCYKIMFQHGIFDFPFNTIRIGTEIKI